MQSSFSFFFLFLPRLMKTLPFSGSQENTLNVKRKLPQGKKCPNQMVDKGKAKSVLEFLQGALNYFNSSPMHCTTTPNYSANACRMEMLL